MPIEIQWTGPDFLYQVVNHRRVLDQGVLSIEVSLPKSSLEVAVFYDGDGAGSGKFVRGNQEECFSLPDPGMNTSIVLAYDRIETAFGTFIGEPIGITLIRF